MNTAIERQGLDSRSIDFPVTIDCFVSAAAFQRLLCICCCIPEKPEKGHSSQFHEFFLMVRLLFNGKNCKVQKEHVQLRFGVRKSRVF